MNKKMRSKLSEALIDINEFSMSGYTQVNHGYRNPRVIRGYAVLLNYLLPKGPIGLVCAGCSGSILANAVVATSLNPVIAVINDFHLNKKRHDFYRMLNAFPDETRFFFVDDCIASGGTARDAFLALHEFERGFVLVGGRDISGFRIETRLEMRDEKHTLVSFARLTQLTIKTLEAYKEKISENPGTQASVGVSPSFSGEAESIPVSDGGQPGCDDDRGGTEQAGSSSLVLSSIQG